MKIEIVIHIPQLSARAKRMLAAVAIPAVLLGGAAVAWAGLPHTWTAGETLTAQNLTDDFDALDRRLAAVEASAPTAWAPYTCHVVDAATGIPVGGDISVCKWRRNGTSVDVMIESTFQSAPGASHKMGWAFPPGVAADFSDFQSVPPLVLGFGSVGANGASGGGAVTVGPVNGTEAFAYYVNGPSLNTSDTGIAGVGAEISLTFSIPVAP